MNFVQICILIPNYSFSLFTSLKYAWRSQSVNGTKLNVRAWKNKEYPNRMPNGRNNLISFRGSRQVFFGFFADTPCATRQTACDIMRVSRRWVTSAASRLWQAGKTRLLLSVHILYIHAYARTYACPPIMRIARVRLHVYPTRDGRAPAYVRRAPSRRVGSLSLPPFSRFAPGKVMSGVHWAPIDKGRRSSTFLSPVSPPPASESAIYIARRLARAGDGITSPRRYVCLELLSHALTFCHSLFYPLPRLPFRVAPLPFNAECTERLNSGSRAEILKTRR